MRRLDHIGVVTDHPTRLVELLVEGLGLTLGQTKELPERGIKVTKVHAENVTLEIISPLRDDSEVSKFLQKKGPGLHHLCFSSSDVHSDVSEMNARGVRLIPDSLKPGAEGRPVAFFHPKDFEGILVELEEEEG